MKCAYHPVTDAVNQCLACSRSLCSTCAHQIRGSVYCEECIVHGAEWAAAVRHLRPPKDIAKRAALIASIPGMGAVYNNQYFKALIFLIIFFSLAAAGDISPLFIFAALIFYVFMIFDAYRTAESLQRERVEGGTPSAHRSVDMNSPIWGGMLIALGLLLMLSHYINFAEVARKLWPLVIILFGLFLVYRSLSDSKHIRQ